jgi:antiviral defense system Shedu protein SduA
LSELNAKRQLREVSPREAAEDWNLRERHEPNDEKLMELLLLMLTGKITCKRAVCELSRIRPYDIDFCLDFPMRLIEIGRRYIQEGKFDPPMLVYWSEDHFVMSDDYALYLAHLSLETKSVPVIILGEVPPDIYVEAEGGEELLPPVTINTDSIDYVDESTKMRLLSRKLRKLSHPPTLAMLYALHITLYRLLQRPSVSERMLHSFLHRYSVVLSPLGLSISSEVPLGADYRIDLAIQTPGIIPQILLVELENPNKDLFTKAGRLLSTTTHAIQQVEDWLRWWAEHPAETPVGLKSSLPPSGLVVIGRSHKLSEADRKRLAHLNSNRKVQVLTYDELALQLETYIKNLEDLQIWE